MIDAIRVFRRLGIARVIAIGLGSGLLLAACGGSESGSEGGSGGGSGSGLEGTYFFRMGDAPGEGFTLELKDDGTAVASFPEEAGMPASQGTHTMEEGKLIVLLSGGREVYTVEPDGTLTVIAMGEKLVGVRQ